VIPTLVFVLWAYGMYALISALSGRKGRRFRARSSWRKYGGLALAAGAAAGIGLVLVMAQSYEGESQRLKLAGFLGTVWAEGWPDKVEQRVEDPPVKSTASGDKPVYALLHPGTSLAGPVQAKAASKPRAHKPKLHKAEVSQARGAKVTARPRK
jgi:hypothetical protein